MQKNITLFLLALCMSICAVSAGSWNAISPSPNVNIDQVSQGTNTIWIMDYNGGLQYTSKSSISWHAKSLPSNLQASYLAVGVNDDVCVLDENYQAWCLKAGMSTWNSIPSPVDYAVEIDIYSYSNGGMVITDYYGNVYFYVSAGNWTQIASQYTNSIYDTAIASGGQISAVDTSGNYLTYNPSTGVWTVVYSGYNFFQIDSGVSATDTILTSSAYPFQDYRKTSTSITNFASSVSWMTILNGYIIGTTTTDVVVWSP